MYNEAQKQRFIKEHTDKKSVETACIRLFNAIEEDEKRWEADICTRSLADVTPVIERISGMRETSNTRLRILQAYIRWCLSKGIEGVRDDILHIKDKDAQKMGTDKIKHQMVRSPKHLQTYLNVICDPEDLKTPDLVIRCFCWMAFSGISLQDTVKVKGSDVDIDKRTITFDGKTYFIYEEAVSVFEKCKSLTEFQIIHPLYGKREVFIPRVPGDILLRSVRSNPSVEVIKIKLNRAAKKHMDISLSYYRAWLSGVFYRAYDLEMGGGIDIKEFFFKFAKEIVDEEHPEYDRRTRMNKYNVKQKNFLKDYKNWKKAFLADLID